MKDLNQNGGGIEWLGVTYKTLLTPSGFEGFFADMARGQCRIPEDMPKVEASARAHHLKFTGPPLGAE